MQVLGIVGPGARTLCDRVAPHLDGRVAVVERSDTGEEPDDGGSPDGVAAAYRVGNDGAWSARGVDRDLDDILDDLAATHDHALLVGCPETTVPTISLGDADHERTVRAADTEADVGPESCLLSPTDAADREGSVKHR